MSSMELTLCVLSTHLFDVNPSPNSSNPSRQDNIRKNVLGSLQSLLAKLKSPYRWKSPYYPEQSL